MVSLTLLICGGDTFVAVLLFKVFLKLETAGCTTELEAFVLHIASGDESIIRIDNR